MQDLNKIKTQLFDKFPTSNISVVCHIVFGGFESNLLSESITSDELNDIKVVLKFGGYNNSEIIITDCEKLIHSTSKINDTIDIIGPQKSFQYITDRWKIKIKWIYQYCQRFRNCRISKKTSIVNI